jgi:phosphatidate phosphatase PAH1
MQGVSRGMALAEQTDQVFGLIQKLSKDVDLLVQRFELAERSVEKTKAELSKMQVSVHKIRKVKMELDVLSGGHLPFETAVASASISKKSTRDAALPEDVDHSTNSSSTRNRNDARTGTRDAHEPLRNANNTATSPSDASVYGSTEVNGATPDRSLWRATAAKQ